MGASFLVLPAVDIKGGVCVRLLRGDERKATVYSADPVKVALSFQAEGAPWLHLVDLDAAFTGVPRNREVLGAILAALEAPCQVSGGMRDEEAVRWALSAGAARVVLGTAALADPSFALEMAARYGERVAVALDLEGRVLKARGWKEPVGFLEEVLPVLEEAGVARFVVTDVSRDGTLGGPGVETLRRVLSLTSRPVIASGGVSRLEDLDLLASLGCEGAVVGRAVYEGRFTVAEAVARASALSRGPSRGGPGKGGG